MRKHHLKEREKEKRKLHRRKRKPRLKRKKLLLRKRKSLLRKRSLLRKTRELRKKSKPVARREPGYMPSRQKKKRGLSPSRSAEVKPRHNRSQDGDVHRHVQRVGAVLAPRLVKGEFHRIHTHLQKRREKRTRNSLDFELRVCMVDVLVVEG
jgi:hypothetical protein